MEQHVVKASSSNTFKTGLDLIKIVNIYGKLTCPGPEVDQECYVIVMI